MEAHMVNKHSELSNNINNYGNENYNHNEVPFYTFQLAKHKKITVLIIGEVVDSYIMPVVQPHKNHLIIS